MTTPTVQLARVGHPSWAKNRILAMIAYFDESGKPEDKPVVSLAAVVASDTKWFRFDVNWMRILRQQGAAIHPKYEIPWFHMTDFESPHGRPYNAWGKDKRIPFIASLAREVKHTMTFGTVHSLVVSDWNEIIVPHLENPYKQKRGWYVFLLQALLEDISRLVKVPRHETIACLFDESKEFSYAAKMHYEGLKTSKRWESIFGSATYGCSAKYPGLQAADMLAFEGRLSVENKIINNSARPIRKLFQSLTEKGRITVTRYDRAGLMGFRNQWMEVKRRRSERI